MRTPSSPVGERERKREKEIGREKEGERKRERERGREKEGDRRRERERGREKEERERGGGGSVRKVGGRIVQNYFYF